MDSFFVHASWLCDYSTVTDHTQRFSQLFLDIWCWLQKGWWEGVDDLPQTHPHYWRNTSTWPEASLFWGQPFTLTIVYQVLNAYPLREQNSQVCRLGNRNICLKAVLYPLSGKKNMLSRYWDWQPPFTQRRAKSKGLGAREGDQIWQVEVTLRHRDTQGLFTAATFGSSHLKFFKHVCLWKGFWSLSYRWKTPA